MIMLLSVFIPILCGVLLLALPSGKIKCLKDYGTLCKVTGLALLITLAFTAAAIAGKDPGQIELFSITNAITISFKMDTIGRIFAVIMALVWTCVGFFGFEYMKHEKNQKRYFGVYILVLGILIGLCFSGNLVTYYAFFEFMTIASFAMVLHNQKHEAIMAGLKYMFYSFAGAYMVLFGLYFVYKNASDGAMNFVQGGIIGKEILFSAENTGILSLSMLLMIIGFSVKAGMFPMHGWLPTAHPVAPAPASAALSAIIVKAGVLGIIRVIYFVFGIEFFDGSNVQKIVLTLSLITVFIGSMLAYKEKLLKKRLAYSTVSQVSYILFGIFMANSIAFSGAMIHVAAHAAIKSTLFMCAGAIIYITGAVNVDQLKGIGKKMPVMLWCYTIVSLGLIGIPPFGGFASKWYLCIGSLKKGMPVFSYLGPVILLLSALLTAGYLLPITINGFLPGRDFEKEAQQANGDALYAGYNKGKEPCLMMLIPIIVLTAATVIIGLFPEVMIWG